MDFFVSLLDAFGGVAGLTSFGLLLVVILVAVFFAGNRKGDGSGMTDRIIDLAGVAVMAVNKLRDNGQYDDLSDTARNLARKNDALQIIEEGLKAEGIKPNPTLMAFAGYAIEFVLKRFDTYEPTVGQPPEVNPPTQ